LCWLSGDQQGGTRMTAISEIPGYFKTVRQKHIPELDGLRGIAVLLVMCFHFGINQQWQHKTGTAYWSIASVGWCGVDLFFVLSGFLITGILFNSKSDPAYFKNFYSRRALRIFPLYYSTIILILIILPAFGAFKSPQYFELVKNQTWLWGFGANILTTLKNTFSVLDSPHFLFSGFWSLAVEEHFYLLWPLLVLSFSLKTLMRLCIAMIVIAPVFRFAFVHYGGWVGAYAFTLCRMDSLAAGALVALAIRGNLLPNRKLIIISTAAALVVFIAIAARYGAMITTNHPMQQAGQSILALLFSGIIAIAATGISPSIGAVLKLRPLIKIGRVSYGMYVFHCVFEPDINRILPISMFHATWFSEAMGIVLHTTCAILITYGVAWLSFNFFEQPINKYKNLFRAREESDSVSNISASLEKNSAKKWIFSFSGQSADVKQACEQGERLQESRTTTAISQNGLSEHSPIQRPS
jgi:peptidoglycan/LPS O-acetylase OafA/YrhL